ncbi:hypothetical protein ACH46N_34930 [Streptomyces pristinaespiralis]|uniref:Predicted protein n=1 Tax=Streptomyces pristinaespiralis (strain ATCC 25486 / DSM 40338 / CBS 914.69 / JCM 4507 / KCC S-0507 / NBRC 13074 / NRRL 2958 / 5647) TaxID=457429 RepID=B5H6L8_STRE2|nr:hypothetical protein [Streptomyces pristinaespiralis]EDY62479.1 predicted protein [Streptomyces pristinaespiralis ATCC 25486]
MSQRADSTAGGVRAGPVSAAGVAAAQTTAVDKAAARRRTQASSQCGERWLRLQPPTPQPRAAFKITRDGE